jgi:hypothetical protein
MYDAHGQSSIKDRLLDNNDKNILKGYFLRANCKTPPPRKIDDLALDTKALKRKELAITS